MRWYIWENEETGAIKELLASEKSYELIYAGCQRKYKYGNVREEIWWQSLEKYKRKSGGILSLGRLPRDKELCTHLENDFVSDTKMKHNYSKALHEIENKIGNKMKMYLDCKVGNYFV